MMQEITDKQLEKKYNIVIKLGASYIQDLLKSYNPVFYNWKRNNWCYTVYAFGDIAICIGYNPIGNFNAADVSKKYSARYVQEQLGKGETEEYILHEFIRNCINSYYGF